MTDRPNDKVIPEISPRLMYGTAWKEENTERLVLAALQAGFRAIDTANQRKHYFEEGVGVAISKAIRDGVVSRKQLFLQTKFTFQNGQDHRLPYDPNAAPAQQVRQSFDSSLQHLQVAAIDSYVLHGPSRGRGLTPVDFEVWAAMEDLQASGAVRFLGISNVSAEQLELLLSSASVKPDFVQNRCYARTGWDHRVRLLCRDHDIVYQGFSLLTANANELRGAGFRNLVGRTGRTPAQVIFRFAQQVGMLPLTGTTDLSHMREDLQLDFDLGDADLQLIETLGS